MRRNIIWVLLFFVFFTGGCSQKKQPTKQSPKVKRYNEATMRSYMVRGKRYHPTYVKVGDKMKGISSWYGPHFHGKKTSNGETYNMNEATAAHKTWPMDTMVRVKNMQNGKNTIVRINDRGPFVSGRIIDCSFGAGKSLGLDVCGTAKVELQVVGFAGNVYSPDTIAKQRKTNTQVKIKLTNFGVQVGAFRHYEGAKVFKRKYSGIDERYYPVIRKFDDVDGEPLYRVWLMGFGSEAEAMDFKIAHHMSDAFIVRL